MSLLPTTSTTTSRSITSATTQYITAVCCLNNQIEKHGHFKHNDKYLSTLPVVALFAPLPFIMQVILRYTRDPFMHSPWVEVRCSGCRQPNCPPWDRAKQGSLSLSITPRSQYNKPYTRNQTLLTCTYTHMHTSAHMHVGSGAVASWICMTHAHTQTYRDVISPGSCSKPVLGGFVRGLI